MTDTIADMLCRLRNAARARHKTVDVKNSRICEGIARVLKAEGYIADYSILDDATHQGLIRLTIKYTSAREPILRDIKCVSRPGCRIYRGVNKFPKVINGMGIAVFSTSRGVLSDRQAREWNIGGELLATVY